MRPSRRTASSALRLDGLTEGADFREAIKTHGLIGTAVNDKNQYGPVGMMVLLFIVAAITSLGLLLIRSS